MSVSKTFSNVMEIVEASSMSVDVWKRNGEISLLRINICGLAAAIPSLKNSKIPGRNFLNPGTLNRVRALDVLWRKATHGDSFSFRKNPVHVMAIFGKRRAAFDLDNALATVRDWLEPATKPVGKHRRGWGIGLIDDDKRVTSYALHAAQLWQATTQTLITVRPFASVHEHVLEFARLIAEREEDHETPVRVAIGDDQREALDDTPF